MTDKIYSVYWSLSLSDLKSILKHEVHSEYKKVIASHGDSFIIDAGFKLLLNDIDGCHYDADLGIAIEALYGLTFGEWLSGLGSLLAAGDAGVFDVVELDGHHRINCNEVL